MLQAMTGCDATVKAQGPANDRTRSAGERQSGAVRLEPPEFESGPAIRPAPVRPGQAQPGPARPGPAARSTAIVKMARPHRARRPCKLVQL